MGGILLAAAWFTWSRAPVGPPPIDMPELDQSPAALEGTWQRACDPERPGLDNKFTSTRRIAGGRIEEHRTYFDRACEVEQSTYVWHARFRTGVAPSGRGLPLDLEVEKATYTPTSELRVDILNRQRACGRDDWKVGEARELLSLECADYDMPHSRDVAYDLYLLRDDGLVFGVQMSPEFDGRTEESRFRFVGHRIVWKPAE